jgi:hypothetical protein
MPYSAASMKGRSRWNAHTFTLELAASLFTKPVELGLLQHMVQLLVKRMPGASALSLA